MRRIGIKLALLITLLCAAAICISCGSEESKYEASVECVEELASGKPRLDA